MASPLIALDRIRHDYQGKTVLAADGLCIDPGTITGLAGPNGSGKSTLLSILGLVLAPSTGTMTFKGKKVGLASVRARRCIALLPQEPYLLKRSVFNNVAYGLTIRKDTENLEKRVHTALETVGLSPGRFVRRHARQLSGGESRRVALAARLALSPDVLLLDEPTTHVDESSSRMIREAVIQSCREKQTTLVISSHDRDWLDSISDRVLTLYDGHMFDQGRINILYGPWKKLQNGTFEGAATRFPLPSPPHENAVAILPARYLHLRANTEPLPHKALSLECLVTGVHLENKQRTWTVFLRLNELTLVATVDSAMTCPVEPGQTVLAYYLSDHISFI